MPNATFTDIVEELKVTNKALGGLDVDIGFMFDVLVQSSNASAEMFKSMIRSIESIGSLNSVPAGNSGGPQGGNFVSGGNSGGTQGGGSNEVPEIKFRQTISSILKGSTLNMLGTKFPSMIKSTKGGFDKMGEMVTGLGKESIERGAANLSSLSSAFTSFAEVKWSKVLFGIGAVRLIGPLFSKLGTILGSAENMKGLASFDKFAKRLGSIAEALSGTFAKIGNAIGQVISGIFQGIADGLSALAKPKVFIGILAMALLAAPVYLMAKAFQEFSEVGWGDVAIGVTAIALLAAGAMVLGTLWSSGVLPLGILALGGLGLAAMAFGAAMLMAGKGMSLFSEGLGGMVDPLITLAGIGPELLVTAAAIGAVGVALAAFGVGQGVAGIGAFFGRLLGGESPVDKLMKLAALAKGLTETANAMDRINSAISTTAPKTSRQMGQLQAESDSMSVAAAGTPMVTMPMGGSGASGQGSSNVTNNVTSTIVNSGYMPDRSTALVLSPAF